MRKYLIHLTLIGSFALSQNYIAVIDFSGNGISANDVNTLTDRFRIELFRTGKFIVAEREMMNQVLDEQGFQQSGCSTDECLVEMGKLIGVSDIIGGSVSKFGNLYSVSLRMVDIELGTIVQSAIYDHEGKFEDLLIKVMKKSAEQFAFAIEPDFQTSETTPSDKSNLEEIVVDQPISEEISSEEMVLDQSSTNNATMELGVIGGLNMTNFTGDDASMEDEFGEGMDPSSLMGFTFGGYMTYRLAGGLVIRTEIHYITKGSKYSFSGIVDGVDLETKFDFTMKYFEIPIFGIYQLNDNISLMAGPYLEYFLNGTMEADVSASFMGESFSESTSEKIKKDEVPTIGYGITLGGSFSINDQIAVEARYSIGLSTIDKEPDDWDSSRDGNYKVGDIKNSGLQR